MAESLNETNSSMDMSDGNLRDLTRYKCQVVRANTLMGIRRAVLTCLCMKRYNHLTHTLMLCAELAPVIRYASLTVGATTGRHNTTWIVP